MGSELTAGRELDALILSRVMGQKYVFIDTPLPHYSTSIEAAWQVVEKMRPDWEVQIQNHEWRTAEPMDGWTVRIGCHIATAPTAPLAICRAALAAVESEVAR